MSFMRICWWPKCGAFIRCAWSALVYNLIMEWNESGVIALGKGMWEIGGEGLTLAQLFGEYGLAEHDHGVHVVFSSP